MPEKTNTTKSTKTRANNAAAKMSTPLNQRKKYKDRVARVQGKPTQTNTNETKGKPAMVSIKNDPTYSTTNNFTIPKVPVTKNEDFAIVQIKKLQNSEEAVLETLRESNTKYDPKPRLIMWSLSRKPKCSAINNANVPAISNQLNRKMVDSRDELDRTIDPNENYYKELMISESLRKSKFHDKVVQDNRLSKSTNKLTIPAKRSIINEGARTVYKMYIMPILAPRREQKNVENDQRRKILKENRRVVIQESPEQTDKDKDKTKSELVSILKAPACSTTTYVSGPLVDSNMDNGKFERRKGIGKLQQSDKVVQDNRISKSTNELTIPAKRSKINEGDHTVHKLYILPILPPRGKQRNLENDQRRKILKENRRVVIQENPRQTDKDKVRTKPKLVSILKYPACSTTNYDSESESESEVDLSMEEEEFEIKEYMRKLQHRLDFPNGSKENPKETNTTTSSCSTTKCETEPVYSLPNWRMEYLKPDIYRIVQNDVNCVSNVDQFLKAIYI